MHQLATLTHRSGLLVERLDVETDGGDVLLFHTTDDAGEPGPMDVLCIPQAMVAGLADALARAGRAAA